MIITVKNGGSLYVCDKCGQEINTEDHKRYKISIVGFIDRKYKEKPMYRYDLCKKCLGHIVFYLKKGK